MKTLSTKITESLNENINEGFFRLSKDVISTDLYHVKKEFSTFVSSAEHGNDIDMKHLLSIIKGLTKIAESVKAFSKKEEVIGTVYENVNESIESNNLINRIKTVAEQFDVFHHNTTIFSQHKAFDQIQSDFTYWKDDLIEKLIGYTGDRYQVSVIPTIAYDDQSGTSLVASLYDLGSDLIAYSKETGYVDIENTGQEIHGLGAKLNYLLTLNS